MALRMRIKELAETRVRYGYRRLHILLRREGWAINHKRVYRLYLQENLTIRRKRPHRHVSAKVRVEPPKASGPNQLWAMDFVSDTLFDGSSLRVLTLVDHFSRESPVLEVGKGFTGERVSRVLDRIVAKHGYPKLIRVDNGPEFTSKALDRWAYLNGVQLDFTRPGTDNAIIESFNASLRKECLNQHWFFSIDDAKSKIENWRREYNALRPHSSLGNLAPQEFARQWPLTKVS
jgi:putative transposase